MKRAAFWVALASPGLIPLLAPYLPFQDWPAHIAAAGAIALRDDPAANIDQFYGFRGWLGPNRLFYALAALLAPLFSALAASNLILALSLAALGPAVAVLCREADTDERLAFFALPLALGKHLYCGFSSNAAALPGLVLALAAYCRLRKEASFKGAFLLAAALWLALGMHAFVFLAAAGIVFALAAIDLIFGPRRNVPFVLGGFLAGLLPFPWFGRVSGGSSGGPSVTDAVWSALIAADRKDLLKAFWEWLFASYRYAVIDDVLQGFWLLVVVIGVALIFASDRRAILSNARGRLFAGAAIAAVMFVVLPTNIGPPVNWWGGNLRLPVMVMLLLLPLIHRRLWAGGAALAMVVVALATFDLVRFSRVEMAGLAEVLDAMPKGAKVSALHYTPRHVHEYPGEPHGYLSNYYLAEKGGLVPQNLFENAGEPFSRKEGANAPPWGYGSAFFWPSHGAGFDAFLVRINDRQPDAPFDGPNASKVRLVKEAGNFRFYEAVR